MDSDYFRVSRPDEQTLPVVVDVPHAGEQIPEEVLDEMVVQHRTLRRDLDLYVDQIWQDAPDCGATLVAANVSRYVVDLNRAADDISPQTVSGGVRRDRPGYYQDRGVVWRTTTDGTEVMPGPMSREIFEKRLDHFYHPYHERLALEIERVYDRFGYCILLDGHSMPSVGRSGHHDPGSRRPDIVPGDVDGASCDRALRLLVESHYRDDCGYSVRSNAPYKGGWITRSYGRPAEGIHAIQIEMNRDLYMDESSFEIDSAGLEALRACSRELLPKLANLDLGR